MQCTQLAQQTNKQMQQTKNKQCSWRSKTNVMIYVDGNIFLQANVLKSSKTSLVYNELGYG